MKLGATGCKLDQCGCRAYVNVADRSLKVDVQRDSVATIKEKWGQLSSPAALECNADQIAIAQDFLPDPAPDSSIC